jgi:hypothetical protein
MKVIKAREVAGAQKWTPSQKHALHLQHRKSHANHTRKPRGACLRLWRCYSPSEHPRTTEDGSAVWLMRRPDAVVDLYYTSPDDRWLLCASKVCARERVTRDTFSRAPGEQ